MAQHWDPSTKPVYEAAESFRNHCLSRDGSLLFGDASIWSLANLQTMRRVFNEAPDARNDRGFLEKYEQQVSGSGQPVIRLAAELLAVYFLFPSNVGGERKRAVIEQVLGWGQDTLPADHVLIRAFSNGIGSGGQGYNTRRPFEIGFLVEMVLQWKQREADARDADLADPWRFQRFIDDIEDADGRQIRHMLLHLLFPAHFERIASRSHKAHVVKSFHGLIPAGTEEQQDRQLFAIREALGKLLPSQEHLDFYEPPLAAAWYDASESTDLASFDLIQFKKQIILYGPPGTSKTHRAERLAERILRAAALDRWGAAQYFRRQEEIDRLVGSNVHSLQLHPAYGYEDFICGLEVRTDGSTGHRLGYLPRLIEQIDREPAETRLPHVLILDEINRTDLSRMLGEAFSLLEKRGVRRDLTGRGENDQPLTLRIPPDLFVIGTMNLIDQSIEQIDFALRRRFLWIDCPFDRDTLLEATEQRWRAGPDIVEWDRVRADFTRLADAAQALNEAIRGSAHLGPQYEIGHAYFFDVIDFLRQDLGERSRARRTFLWSRHGPRQPIEALWNLSIQPLLREYLSGLDTPTRDAELKRLQGIFFATPDLPA